MHSVSTAVFVMGMERGGIVGSMASLERHAGADASGPLALWQALRQHLDWTLAGPSEPCQKAYPLF